MKKLLSTALIFFLIFSFPVPNCFASDLTLTADGTWASSGTPTGADVAHAAAGDNVALDSTAGDVTLTVTNNGAANDGSGLNTFVLGNITDAGAGNAEKVLINAPAAAGGNLSVTISSAATGGTFTVQNTNNTNKNVTATVSNALTVGGAGGNLTVTNNETTNDGTSVGLTVGGNLSVGNTAVVTAAAGAGAGANATLTLQGASNTFTAGLSLNDNAAGTAALTLSGTDQTVTGTIDGSAAGEGTLNVNNTGNATFANNIGNSNVLKAVNIASAATKIADFDGVAVKATTVTVNGAGTGNFDGIVTATALNITSTGEAELNSASTITTTTLTGAGTLDLDATLTGNVVFGSGGDGAVAVAGGSSIMGSVNNSTASAIGTLTVESGGNSTVNGAVGSTKALKAVNVQSAALQTADFNSTVAASTITVSGAGKGNFDGAVTATALNITSTGEADLNTASTVTTSTFTGTGQLSTATLTGNIVFGAGGDGLIYLYGGSEIIGSIDNATDTAIGTLNVGAGGSSTIRGAVGSTTALKTIDIGAILGESVTFNSTVRAQDLNIYNETSVFLNGDTTANVVIDANGNLYLNNGVDLTGTILNASDGAGSVTYLGNSTTGGDIGTAGGNGLLAVNIQGGGIVSLGHNITAVTTIVDSAADGGTLSLTRDCTITGDLAIDDSGVLTLGANTLTVDGIYTQGIATTLNTTIINTTTFGNIIAVGDASVDGGTLYVTVGSTSISNGATFVIIDGAAGSTITVPTILDDSNVVSFTGSVLAGDLILTASRINSLRTATAGDSNATAAAEALENASETSSNSDMQEVITTVQGLSSNQEIESSIKTMTPNASSGAMQASQAATGQFLGTVSGRLGFARSGLTGIATGDMIQGMGFWAQGLGSHLRQHERNGIQGYSANLLGISMGADKLLDQHVRVGLAGGYGYGAVNSKTPGSPTDDINSFSGALYGSFDSINLEKAGKEGKKSPASIRNQDHNWYTDGMFAFTQNNYESRREIWITPTNRRVAKADHYGQQYTTKVETGYTLKFKVTKSLETTPFASLRYSYLRMNKYSEKGADSLDLTVRGEGYNQLEQGLGVKFAYPIESKKAGTFIPAVKAAWLFDYIADQFETTAAFAGGGTSFETKGAKPARSGLLLGTELAFLNRDNLTLTANYDMELKDAFISNTYYLTARLDF